ncbi:MAG: LON peptidase substrate-binding domain-containing protein [Bryobacteraceae bacterium]
MLPLFPLPVVVFPRTRLPLHIFEERYKEMVGEAIRDHSEFGIVLARDNEMLSTGCSVIVERVLKEYPDGRMDIVTAGVRRFTIDSLDDDKSYLRGEVSFFDDDEDPAPAPDDLRRKALEEYRHWLDLEEPGPFSDAVLTDPQLSFQLAQGLPDVDFLQKLLRDRSENSRLKHIAQFLTEFVPKRRFTAKVKEVAPLNGHTAKAPGMN